MVLIITNPLPISICSLLFFSINLNCTLLKTEFSSNNGFKHSTTCALTQSILSKITGFPFFPALIIGPSTHEIIFVKSTPSSEFLFSFKFSFVFGWKQPNKSSTDVSVPSCINSTWSLCFSLKKLSLLHV